MICYFRCKIINSKKYIFCVLQFNFSTGDEDVDFIPTGGISNVNTIVFEFTPQLPNRTCFFFYNLSIEACCEGKKQK